LKRKRDEKVAQRSMLRHAPKDSNVGSPPQPAIIVVEFPALFNFMHNILMFRVGHASRSYPGRSSFTFSRTKDSEA
jgi:hypothetical protein